MKIEFCPVGSAELPLPAEELLEFAKSEEFVRVMQDLGRPVPCEQGAADCYPFGTSADPTFVRPGASDLCGFVKQQK